ncbi:uncharacterized protein MYCFIDRAFT_81333 [Pseudocercospora fijiensis CIRAD86]|uniref:Uncharacterized protein n=1 Tax=Pseudocercospora fijiensis (strain CIRAD86) TaxID=383855 RepID=M2YU73_PSEFD|nr:uncharacterized protein MYCFIDRAFT_81333 [Pseudocercospora fijiensis CIRAD86]EME81260.1 hypothetical protein MYCFIDRAFT_81333 [Pseudocercospora fijiensis CIRAD86]
MNFAPYQWRHDQGYLPPPGSVPIPIIPAMSAPQLVHQIAYQTAPPPPPPAYCFPPNQPFLAASPPPPPPPPKPCSQAPSHTFTIATQTSEPKPPPAPSTVASSNAYAPPTLRPGTNYLFPSKSSHTMLHIFSKASTKIWEHDSPPKSLNFKIFKVATNFRVKDVIERVLKTGDCEGWCVTEVVEVGGGRWRKGTTVKFGEEKGLGTLADMGWNGRRGGELPPVWLVVHKE